MMNVFHALCLRLLGLATGVWFGAAAAEAAQATDPHALFEARCGRCHGHAGALTRSHVVIEDGVLRAASSRQPLDRFLPAHVGGLAGDEIAVLLDMFARQLAFGGVYERRCRICHDRASQFVRLRLALRDGAVVSRLSGEDVAAFLERHGRTTPEERQRLLDMFRFQLETAPATGGD